MDKSATSGQSLLEFTGAGGGLLVGLVVSRILHVRRNR